MRFKTTITKDSIALIIVTVTAVGFFFAGIFDILNYIIVQVLLFLCLAVLLGLGLNFAIQNEKKENRPKDKLQDDLH
ncbi:hypothetical protein [Winogradskyella endarachnes]|uniref:Uncharacterized protein n=1 Tax=Winogradskyella endarachnes TaxID=2681965 RepID=A0A6L6U8C3_9FLAO|nr:hypothetical protein [Winogradskyella endarachnes]MUU78269.1 hypothetical protein [Winogradskyella endarachnes]